jgi:hypothetical protein
MCSRKILSEQDWKSFFFTPYEFVLFVEGRAVAAAVSFSGKLPFLASVHGRTGSSNVARQWISGALAFPAAG